jgi:hypothetical protein
VRKGLGKSQLTLGQTQTLSSPGLSVGTEQCMLGAMRAALLRGSRRSEHSVSGCCLGLVGNHELSLKSQLQASKAKALPCPLECCPHVRSQSLSYQESCSSSGLKWANHTMKLSARLQLPRSLRGSGSDSQQAQCCHQQTRSWEPLLSGHLTSSLLQTILLELPQLQRPKTLTRTAGTESWTVSHTPTCMMGALWLSLLRETEIAACWEGQHSRACALDGKEKASWEAPQATGPSYCKGWSLNAMNRGGPHGGGRHILVSQEIRRGVIPFCLSPYPHHAHSACSNCFIYVKHYFRLELKKTNIWVLQK